MMSNQETPGQRLAKVREARGYRTSSDAARAHGWTVSTYISHENGNRPLSKKVIVTYANAFDCPAEWLAYGVGDMNGSNPAAEHISDNSSTPPVSGVALRKIPVIRWGNFSSSTDYLMLVKESTEYTYTSASLPVDGKQFCMIIPDDSMVSADKAEISYSPGDEVIFTLGDKGAPGTYVLAIVDGEDVELFRKYVRGGKRDGQEVIKLMPLNPDYDPVEIVDGVNGRIVGRAIRHIRSI
jgi:SOS-response transcriptional repressor LexA